MIRSLPLLLSTLAAGALLYAACGPRALAPGPAEERFVGWKRYEAEPGATHFSPLDQINRDNVDRLEIAWTYETPGVGGYNPLVVDSILYVTGAEGDILQGGEGTIIALHAATGRELWRHVSSVPGLPADHGIMYWENEDRSDRRLLFAKGSYDLLAIDALTGAPVASFGENGRVDLRQGLGIDPGMVTRATSPTPGVVFGDLVILGSAPGEGYFASPGHVRAFDVRTGRQRWIFHTLPQAGEFGYDTWPVGRPERGGGANVWGGMSLDEKRGIVYLPIGSANYDFYGVDRPGQNLFANALVALDARTGKRLWHFQTVHHDLWDYDLTATPVLLTVRHAGKPRDIVALATKTGFVFVFDRVTGEPLWPIEERAVPRSTMPGEEAWPTQPFPTKPVPFVPQTMTLDDLNPHLPPAERDSVVRLIRGLRYEGMFTPPSVEGTLQVPGNRGGANWGATGGDPRDGTFYVLSYNMPSILKLEAITAGAEGTGGSPVDVGQGVYQTYCRVCHGADRQGQPAGGIPSLVGVTDRMSHDQFEQVVRGGRRTMPPFPQLTRTEFEGLRAFLANPELALAPGEAQASASGTPAARPTRYQSGWIHLLDRNGIPVIEPPWFRLTAYDLNTGEMKWQVPAGDVPHLAERGIRDTGAGMWVRGGPAVTAGGLLFVSTGEVFRAYDRDTGAELWSASLPGIGDGIPTVYAVDGRQYIVVPVTERGWAAAFGQPKGTRPHTPSYVAFALPATRRP